MASKNNNLHQAKKAKNDEFYTMLSDIEKEMVHYKDFFKGKVVYCNCDDPRESNFFLYFSERFESLGLKKLITTGYKANGKGVIYIYEGDKNGNRIVDNNEVEAIELQGNGDFRSEECINYLKQADVVVTNPPFSLFREYVAQLMAYNKKFIIIGNTNVATYKEIFPLIKANKLWIGVTNYNVGMHFYLPDSYTEYKEIKDGKKIGRVSTSCWWTNIDNKRRNETIDLYKKYNSIEYPKYDNYDAIEVNNYQDIPVDYDGVMGVPITFLGHYNPAQFEILDINPHFFSMIEKGLPKPKQLSLKNYGLKDPYARILIKRIQSIK